MVSTVFVGFCVFLAGAFLCSGVVIYRLYRALVRAQSTLSYRSDAPKFEWIHKVKAPLLVKTKDLGWLAANDAFLDLVGLERAELVDCDDFKFFEGSISSMFERGARRVAEGGSAVYIEESLLNQRGQNKVYGATQEHFVDGHGDTYIVCTFIDLTSLHAAKQALKESEGQLRAFIGQMPMAVAMFDTRLICLATSDTWLHCAQILEGSVVGQPITRAFPDLPQCWNQAHVRALCGESLRMLDDKVELPNGEVHWMNWEVRPWSIDGCIGGFIAIKEYTDEKKKILRELESTKGRQVEASRLLSIGQMAAGVAHEINNPLTVIMGKAWLLQEKAEKGAVPPETVSDSARKITQYAERIGKIVKSLRSFARDASADPMTICSVAEIFTDAISMCGERFRNHGIELRVMEMPDKLFIKCRPTQVSQILVNLLNNAFDSVRDKENPWVSLSAQESGSEILIRVRDSGPGVSEENEKKIFEAFFTTKEVGKGTGLGLSISTGIAKDHGGHLMLDVATSRSCFLLRLPRHEVARSVA